MQNFSVYSLADVTVIIDNPNVGRCVISKEGGGRLTINHTGDLSSHTTTATGYVVVNKLHSVAGSTSLEMPQNSPSDKYLRKLIKFLKTAPTDQFALTNMTVNDPAGEKVITMTGLTPQRWPDENYDQVSSNRGYVFLAAEIAET